MFVFSDFRGLEGVSSPRDPENRVRDGLLHILAIGEVRGMIVMLLFEAFWKTENPGKKQNQTYESHVKERGDRRVAAAVEVCLAGEKCGAVREAHQVHPQKSQLILPPSGTLFHLSQLLMAFVPATVSGMHSLSATKV